MSNHSPLYKYARGLALNKVKGFTLIELMIVIAVIAILATIALFGVTGAQKSGRDTQRSQISNGIRASVERYNGDRGSYPGPAFSDMMSLLSARGYMAQPIDPGCGAGADPWIPGATDANKNWAPCGNGTAPTYAYTSGTGVYTIVLYKESGGNITFKSPL